MLINVNEAIKYNNNKLKGNNNINKRINSSSNFLWTGINLNVKNLLNAAKMHFILTSSNALYALICTSSMRYIDSKKIENKRQKN